MNVAQLGAILRSLGHEETPTAPTPVSNRTYPRTHPRKPRQTQSTRPENHRLATEAEKPPSTASELRGTAGFRDGKLTARTDSCQTITYAMRKQIEASAAVEREDTPYPINLFFRFKLVFAHAAQRTYPIVMNVFESCPRRNAAIGVSFTGIIDIVAYYAHPSHLCHLLPLGQIYHLTSPGSSKCLPHRKRSATLTVK